jgi:hypothetical protein
MWCDHDKRIINIFASFEHEEARESVIRSVFRAHREARRQAFGQSIARLQQATSGSRRNSYEDHRGP